MKDEKILKWPTRDDWYDAAGIPLEKRKKMNREIDLELAAWKMENSHLLGGVK